MVYLIAMRAPPNTVNELRAASTGFYALSDGNYLMASPHLQAPWLRDWLQILGATNIVVFTLQRGWATGRGQGPLAEWLRGAAHLF